MTALLLAALVGGATFSVCRPSPRPRSRSPWPVPSRPPSWPRPSATPGRVVAIAATPTLACARCARTTRSTGSSGSGAVADCRCSHGESLHRRSHRRGESHVWRCDGWYPSGEFDARGFQKGRLCACTRFDDSRLPSRDERLEFGVHHMGRVAAEAPAWPIGERAIERRIRRAARLRD